MLWREVPLYPRKHASQTATRVPLARQDIALFSQQQDGGRAQCLVSRARRLTCCVFICASGGTVYTMVLEAIAERLESSNLSLRTNLNNVRFV